MARRRGRQTGRPLFVIVHKNTVLSVAVSLALALVAYAASRPFLIERGVISAGEPADTTKPLEGQVIYIDPGHGGIDPGACGSRYLEKDIALNVALYLGVRLEKSRAKVVYSRTGDYDLESDEIDDVTARQRLIDSSGATIVLSLHCNAFTDPRERGAQTFYNAKKHPDSEKLARLIQEILRKETDTDREHSARLDHFMLNYGNVPAATVELGFLSNPEEEALLGSPAYQQKLAECIRQAVISFVHSSS